jgi:TonB family protein
MKSNILRLGSLMLAMGAAVVLPAGAATGTALVTDPSILTDVAPRPVAQPAPVYSAYLRHAVIEGQVEVAFTVSPHGDVAEATIVSSTDRLLNKPTLDAVMKWHFLPAMKAGVPVSRKVREVVAFTIPDAPR